MPLRNQGEDAQHIYDSRAERYDDSWHPRFARHMIEIANITTGEDILDLACGTGLASYHASTAVGETGSVTGVDISTGMLALAQRKSANHSPQNVTFHRHSVTELATLDVLQGRKFDAITCCSALVLLPDAAAVVKEWTEYLKPGGRLIVDVTHPQNHVVGIIFERVGRRLGIQLPYYRAMFQTPRDLEVLLKNAGLERVAVRAISQQDQAGAEDLVDYLTDPRDPRILQEYTVDQVQEIFEAQVDRPWTAELGTVTIRDSARQIFKEEWIAIANADGKILDVDCVFVGIGYLL